MTDPTQLFSALQTLVAPVLGYGVKLLWDIREHLRVLNGRVTRLEEWQEGHERLDEERTKLIRQDVRDCKLQHGNGKLKEPNA